MCGRLDKSLSGGKIFVELEESSHMHARPEAAGPSPATSSFTAPRVAGEDGRAPPIPAQKEPSAASLSSTMSSPLFAEAVEPMSAIKRQIDERELRGEPVTAQMLDAGTAPMTAVLKRLAHGIAESRDGIGKLLPAGSDGGMLLSKYELHGAIHAAWGVWLNEDELDALMWHADKEPSGHVELRAIDRLIRNHTVTPAATPEKGGPGTGGGLAGPRTTQVSSPLESGRAASSAANPRVRSLLRHGSQLELGDLGDAELDARMLSTSRASTPATSIGVSAAAVAADASGPSARAMSEGAGPSSSSWGFDVDFNEPAFDAGGINTAAGTDVREMAGADAMCRPPCPTSSLTHVLAFAPWHP